MVMKFTAIILVVGIAVATATYLNQNDVGSDTPTDTYITIVEDDQGETQIKVNEYGNQLMSK